MAIPKRFALSTLLLAMLFVSLLFGYAQWRRQRILRAEHQLKAQGGNILIGDDWFWPIVSSSGSLSVSKNVDGTFSVGKEILSEAEAMSRFRKTAAGMREIGVETIDIEIGFTLADGREGIVWATERWLD